MNSDFFTGNISLPNKTDWEFFQRCSADEYLKEIQKSLETSNRFFVDHRFVKLMYWFSQEGNENCIAEQVLNVKSRYLLYRARIYDEITDQKERGQNTENEPDDSKFFGYGKNGSFVPPIGTRVGGGRANPEGIIYLYAANDVETAIAEVNPSLESEVSVAKIAIKQNLRILNFANLSATSTGPDERLTAWKRNFILGLTRIFNTPASGVDYLLCQYVSELAKIFGFDGIAFRSSKVKLDFSAGKGINYTIFNYDKCEAVSSRLYYVANRSMELKERDCNGYYQPLSEKRGEDD